jgi:putative transposase
MSFSNRVRWIAPWKGSATKPEVCHVVSRIVGRQWVMEEAEKEHFRMLMRMCERFTGCRVLSYCLMSNHFHILLEVTPVPEGGISDEELFTRLAVFYNEAEVAEIAQEMADAGSVRELGEFELPPLNEKGLAMTQAGKQHKLLFV